MYLLDTNICVFLIRQTRPGLPEIVRRHAPSGLYLSTLTIAELEYGAARSRLPQQNRIALLKFALPFTLLPFDQKAAVAYGDLRALLDSRGTPIGPIDTLLAAQALARDFVFVTDNTREFDRVPGLRVENWAG